MVRVVDLLWPIRFVLPEHYNTSETFNDTFPTTREGIDTLWDSITYAPEEIITSVLSQFADGGYEFKDSELDFSKDPKELLGRRVGCLSLDQVKKYCKGIMGKISIIDFFQNSSMTPFLESATPSRCGAR